MANYPTSENRTMSRSQHKSGAKMKRIVMTALILSSIAIILSVYAGTQLIIQGSKSAAVAQTNTVSAAIPPIDVPQDIPQVETTTPDVEEKTTSPQEKVEHPASVTTTKVVYLTFDDGPSKYTDTIVDLLQEKGIHATFFMIGSQLTEHEDSVKRTIELGNYVGLHSMSHSKKKLYDSGKTAPFLKEYQQEQELVNQITGTTPWLIRAPYGSKPGVNAEIRDSLAEANFKMWDWTVDSKDWNYAGKPDKIIQEIKRQVHRDTEVILMHEKSQTIQALPDIIDYLQKKGYSFAVYKPEMHFPVNFAKDDRL